MTETRTSLANEYSPNETWIALLGRRDTPVDGVEDYCTFLAQALAQRGVALKIERVEWAERGWVKALFRLWHSSAEWRGKWVLLQFTALNWSRRGFPVGALVTLAILKRRGARCAVVFHEFFGRSGPRWIDRLRGAFQDWIGRALYQRADKSIFTAPLPTIAWLPKDGANATFISIGANIPAPEAKPRVAADRNGAGRTVAIFCLSDPPHLQKQLDDISQAVRAAADAAANLRVVFLGRGTAEAKDEIKSAFAQIPVKLSNLGLQDAKEISRVLAESDVMLCVRGHLYPSRGSALAGITCGLPIVGYAGAAEGTPLMEAGIQLVPYRDADAMGRALARILADDELRAALGQRSREAHGKFFSWNVIASRFLLSLNQNLYQEQ
ncbi:MAG TPA: glycosyltransferase family 4 protein [Candidatus Limnocylindria bacterium]|nr:glycosyltransferase family 4 protein [Candidatus Limnocylindria bacterium]